MSSTGDRISLNASAMAIQDVLRLIAEHGGLNIAVAGDVTGTVTLRVADCPKRALLDLVVDMAGAASATQGGIIRIVTRKTYESEYGNPFHEVRGRSVFNLVHAQAHDVAGVLGQLKSDEGLLIEDARANAVMAFDLPARLEAMQATVVAMDRPLETRGFPVRYLAPQRLAERLKSYLAPATRVEADPAGQRILVTGTAGALDEVGGLISTLDQGQAPETRRYPLAYARPDSVRALVQALLTPDLGDVRVDARTPALFVTDFPSRLELVHARIAQLDVPTRQVLLEARIIQVSLDDETKTGIDWSILQEKLNGTAVRASFPILTNVEPGIRAHHDLASQSYQVIAEALETFGRTNLLSSPRVMVADGQSARIHVGSQVPYVTIDTREGPNGVLDRFEKVTIVNVGVLLEVTARIHGADMVSLEIRPEVSSVTGFSNNIPVVEATETSSTLLVQDGRTVILGGLNRVEETDTRRGVPLLSHIPLLQYLVSSTVHHKVRTELAIVLTPHILTGTESAIPEQGK